MLHYMQRSSSNATMNDANLATLKQDRLGCKTFRLNA